MDGGEGMGKTEKWEPLVKMWLCRWCHHMHARNTTDTQSMSSKFCDRWSVVPSRRHNPGYGPVKGQAGMLHAAGKGLNAWHTLSISIVLRAWWHPYSKVVLHWITCEVGNFDFRKVSQTMQQKVHLDFRSQIIFVLIFILFSKNNFRSYSILVLKIIFVFNFVLRQRLIASAYMLTITWNTNMNKDGIANS